jgi:Zn-dependent protease with chaperone function
MQYFRQQQEARQLTHRLVLLFLIGMLAVTVAISFVMLTLAATISNGLVFFRLPDGPWLLQHQAAVISTVLLVWGVTGSAILLKRIELRAGGGAVARSLGGERIDTDSRDPLYRRLHNIVEEMSIAAGIALPEVYVLPREAGINALAAGLSPADAAIAVTRGALELLTRDELQGVVAHEFSHIVNNDIRLNMNLIGWLYGLMALSAMARGLCNFAPTDEHGRRSGFAPVYFAAAAVLVLGYVGMLFGHLIQAAVARRREALADASAVQFTRNPDGLRSALLKIAASDAGTQLREVGTDEIAHLLFFPPTQRWFATHPPLEERIRALGAAFDANELPRIKQQLLMRHSADSPGDSESRMAVQSLAPVSNEARLATTEVVASISSSCSPQLQRAQDIRASLPAAVTEAAVHAEAATALLLTLALSVEPPLRLQQLAVIGTRLGSATADRCESLLPVVDALQSVQRQPVLQLLLPQLRQLPGDARLKLSGCLNGILELAGPPTVAQYALRKLVQIQLYDAFAGAVQHSQLKLTQAIEPIAQLLTVLAQQGHQQMDLARQAYELAMQHLGLRDYPTFTIHADWPRLLDTALLHLDQLHPMAKQALLEAMMTSVAHDGQVMVQELELLRVFSACLHCPLPPAIQTLA